MPLRTTRAGGRPGSRASRFLLGLAALIGMLAFLVAVPLVLLTAWRHLGPPLPSLQDVAGPDDGTLFVRVLCLISWAGWITFIWAILAEILAQWRGWHLPAWTWQQRLVAAMISAIAIMLASPAVVSATASPVRAAPARAAPAAVAPLGPASAPAAELADTPGGAMPRAAPTGYIEHIVQPGEQLTTLAERFLGDKYQWHAIAAATSGIAQPDGRQLCPGQTRLYPGWTVRIPVAATAGPGPATGVRPTATPAATSAQAGTMVYETRRGDWVWYVAERFLGDPLRYPDIARLNPHLAKKYGASFPDHIEPGDTLRLPADARDRGSREHATGAVGNLAPPPAAGDSPGGTGPTQDEPGPSSSASPPPRPSVSPSATVTTTPSAPSPAATTSTAPLPAASTQVGTPIEPHGGAPPADDQDGSGIDLGDHGWVTVEVAAAVAAAAALVWIHRRRRYRSRPPGPAKRDDPDLTPLPRAVAALSHARRTSTTEDDMDASEPQTRDAALVTTASIGSHAGKPLGLPDLPALGVGLTGPGSTSAARGLLTSVLSAGGPWAPGAEATIITTADDLRRLLPTAEHAVPELERLHVADSVEHALDEFERHLLLRARLASDTADLVTVLGSDDDMAPAPAVFLTTAPIGKLATRLAAVLTVGARLALVGTVLGAWPAGQTWHVNADGGTMAGERPGPRLNVLDPIATVDILDTVHQAHPTDDGLPPAQPWPSTPGTRANTPLAARQPPTPDPAPSSAATAAPAAPAMRRLHITVLGKPTVEAIDGDQRTGLRIRRSDGVQILVHLAVNPDGATSDELMALLWPEIRPRHSRGRFHTTISELRHTLAEAVGSDPIARTDERYHLDPSLVEVDLWTLNATIDQAATAVEPAQHVAALRQTIDLYTGAIASGHSWLWLPCYREATRRHIIDAHVALAEGEPEPRRAL
ncbi:MAG: LysM peptidoglycan-binding domain-containing protein, partial [Micromonosporaceae bacterium]|nr:LysM peptidoglycan-binding domain-containing protein [Micromonosporaceae bacterium]